MTTILVLVTLVGSRNETDSCNFFIKLMVIKCSSVRINIFGKLLTNLILHKNTDVLHTRLMENGRSGLLN